MVQLLLLRGAKQLLTVRGPSGIRRGAALQDLGIIEDGSVLIRDGKILSVGSARRVENLKEAKNAIDVPVHGALIMPGFVDAGIQLSLYARPTSPGSAAKRKTIAAFYQESLTLMRSCLQHGTLNAQAKTFSSGGSAAADLATLRQLARLANSPVGLVRSWRLHPQAQGDPNHTELLERIAYLKKRKLAQMVEMKFPSNGGSAEELWPVAAKTGLGLNLAWSGGPAGQMGELFARAEPRSIFCPAELSAEECAVLAGSQALAVFSPCKELLEERDNRAVRRLADAGGAIALASGYDSRDAPIFSMQMVVALAVLRLRLTVEQAITATTINAAHALGLGHEIGSLEVGKRADLVVLNLSDYREIPRRFGVNHVGMAIRDGNLVINRNRPKASSV